MRTLRLACLALVTALFATFGPLASHGDTSGAVVEVTSFGADPTGTQDSTPAVQQAIAHAKTLTPPVRILFPRGTYQLYPDHAPVRELYVSNTVGDDPNYRSKRIAMLLEDATDITIDGGGSRLVMHGQQVIFAALRSTGSTITNVELDWVSPRVVDLTVVAAQGSTRDIRIPDGYQYSVVAGNGLAVSSENSPYTGQPYWSYPNIRNVGYAQIVELGSGRSTRVGNAGALFNGVTSVAEVSPGILRLTYDGGSPAAVGTAFQIRTTVRDTPGMLAFESADTTISDMRLGYLHGFGIVAQLNDGLTVRGVDFRARADTWRQSSAFADLIQVSGDKGEVLIEDNRFGFAHDDPINVHGTYVQFVARNDALNQATFEYRHHETAGFPQFYPGDEAVMVDRRTMLDVPDWIGRVVAVDGPSGYDRGHNLRRMTVTFDRPLPAGVTSSDFVAENLTYSPSLTVRGNHFESIPTRGLLVTTRKPVLVEDNVFDQMEMAAIYVSGDANSWYESSAVRDMTIRGNTFIRHSLATGAHPVILFEPIANQLRDEKVHRNVTITDNTFLVGDSTVLDARSVEGLKFTDNRILRYDGGLAPTLRLPVTELAPGQGVTGTLQLPGAHSRALFQLRGLADVTFGGNIYDDGLNRGALLHSMTASAVTNTDDALTIGASNTSPSRVVGWTSSDESVATVDAAGLIIARAEGTAEIRAWVQTPAGVADSASATVTVTADPQQPDAGEWKASDAFTVVRPVAGRASATTDGALQLVPEGTSLWATGNNVGNLHTLDIDEVAVGQSVTVQMTGRTQSYYEESGIGFYAGDDDYILLQRKHNGGTRSVTLVSESGGAAWEAGVPDSSADVVWLRLTRTAPDAYRGSYSTDGQTFVDVGAARTNATASAARLAFVVAGSNVAPDQRPRFLFEDLDVAGQAVALTQQSSAVVTNPVVGADSPERPTLPSRVAQLASATFTGIDLAVSAAELASGQGVVRAIPADVESWSVEFETLDPAAVVTARLDGLPLPAREDGSFLVPVSGGANVLEVWVTAADGASQRIHRWTTLSERRISPAPEPTATPTVTVTPTVTITPTVTVTPTVTLTPTTTATPTVTLTPTATATATVTAIPTPTTTVTVRPTATRTPTTSSTPSPSTGAGSQASVHTTPGHHQSGGRAWYTSCEPYSSTVRCRTEIWATQARVVDGSVVMRTGWHFNNLTYLPLMKRAAWGANPLATTGSWTAADGRQWRTECDTALTGRGGCRSFASAQVVIASVALDGSIRHEVVVREMFNNIVLFQA